ncbi:MAG TPA: AbrB/MazE/SpoVT family DNA-binding domain-containing protein [Acidobacteriota bacterium]|nr:AbrB/MazE/SpoVT family DNA-binding domain-containing protein [Acidobacteriota bacterium]
MRTRVTERGQITIPKRLRQRLGIRPGQVLEVREEEGRIVAVKDLQEDPLLSVTGILQIGLSTDDLMRGLRGDPDTT